MQENKEGKEGDVQVGSQRIIKKYPNRRLYDTNTSSYITLAEVKQLVMDSEPVVIRDAERAALAGEAVRHRPRA